MVVRAGLRADACRICAGTPTPCRLATRINRAFDEEHAMGQIGLPELLIILLILVVLFGATKIPKLGRGLGEGIKNFTKGLRGGDDDESETRPPAEDPR